MICPTPVLVLVSSIFFILSGIKADDDCKRLKNNPYELYGTKTLYETARAYLNKLDEDGLPKSFDDDTLEEEHQDLLKDQCIPVAFYFIGRHAARFPDADDIEDYNKKLIQLKDVLRKYGTDVKCPDKLAPFMNWTSKMVPRNDNLITEIGAKQQRDIAKRFKKLYPEFFSTNTSDITIGVTKKIRTAETAAEFLKEVDGFNITECKESSLPSHDLEQPTYSIDKILQNTCYKTLIENYTVPFLEFDKECSKIRQKGPNRGREQNVLLEMLDDPKLLQGVAKRVSKKLGLPENATMDVKTVDTIFDVCKHERAFEQESIWCYLFEEGDIKLIEYIKDLEIYIKSAYGPNANSNQACPLIKDLVEKFKTLSLSVDKDEKRKVYLYFSHASPMKKLLAAFHLFQNDDNVNDRVNLLWDRLKIPNNRQWQSSLIVPFSANLVFTLYRCQKPGKALKHKILASVTERPVKIGSCKDTDCKTTTFFGAYDRMRDCDLNKICR